MSEESKDGFSRRNLLGLGLAGATALALTARVQAQNTTGAKIEAKQLADSPDIIAKADQHQLLTQEQQSNTEPFNRPEKEQVEWDTIRDKIQTDLKLTTDGRITGELNLLTTRIESNFTFSPEESDDDFSSFHIEPLIDQAADLLDRGVRDRSDFDDLSVKMFELALELNEYADLDAIHGEEEEKGIYEVNRRQSLSERDAEQFSKEASDTHEKSLQNIINEYYSEQRMNELFLSSRVLAFINALPPYQLENLKPVYFNAHQYPGLPAKASHEFAPDMTETLSKHELHLGKSSLQFQKSIHEWLSKIAGKRADALSARTSWDLNNSDFMRRRTKVARKYQDIKAKSASAANGILNYKKRTDALRNRFFADFRNAKARLLVAETGLSEIYDYKPEVKFPRDEKAVDYFDQCLLWTRNAIQWLIRFSRMDQSLVLPISIRQVLGEKDFKDSRSEGKWIFDLPDSSVEEFLKDMFYVRLRGLSVCTIKSDPAEPDRIWQVRVIPPRKAKIRYFSGWKKDPLDQSKIPPCLLARVTDRNFQKDADIVGLSSLYNASPLGRWSVQFFNPIPSTSNFNDIKDIQLELHLAFRYSKDFRNIKEENL